MTFQETLKINPNPKHVYSRPFPIPDYDLDFDLNKLDQISMNPATNLNEIIEDNQRLLEKIQQLQNDLAKKKRIEENYKLKLRVDELTKELESYKGEKKLFLKNKQNENKKIHLQGKKQILEDGKNGNAMIQNILNLTDDISKAFFKYGSHEIDVFETLKNIISKPDLELTGEGENVRCPEIQEYLESLLTLPLKKHRKKKLIDKC
ncbi:hypothetical protein TRFO_09663 [Tritrichomonas foetus]|uniref:Uncharacterized protein n=1 Tax=Tritrichomonas foetus TaxID=1144522 RepID=A0A1J4JD48_9EUKA|nr:hypothetical protein TRFO_09663 [Tritrichomonas foetus]|eukprot:OHS97098.1 hypothetical protein TRFO_09663 [Tritrichomonas foetus]